MYVNTVKECHTKNGQIVLKDKLSPDERDTLPELSTINNLLKEKMNDEVVWLPCIQAHANFEGSTGIIQGQELGDLYNDRQYLKKVMKAIITQKWTLGVDDNKPISYGFCLFVMLDILLSLDKWEVETFTLLTKINDCVRDFIFFAADGRVNFIRTIESEAAKIETKKKTEAIKEKKCKSLATSYIKRDEALRDFIALEAKEGRLSELKRPFLKTLANKIVARVDDHNTQLRKIGKEELYPTEQKAITSKLKEFYKFLPGKELPKNYIDILKRKKYVIAAI